MIRFFSVSVWGVGLFFLPDPVFLSLFFLFSQLKRSGAKKNQKKKSFLLEKVFFWFFSFFCPGRVFFLFFSVFSGFFCFFSFLK